jgi:hypothetical protein
VANIVKELAGRVTATDGQVFPEDCIDVPVDRIIATIARLHFDHESGEGGGAF